MAGVYEGCNACPRRRLPSEGDFFVKPRRVVRPTHLHLSLPEDVRTRLDLFLWSDLEQRIPQGAYQTFFLSRIREFFSHRTLDLAPFLGTPPGTFIVKGDEEVLRKLTNLLERSL